MPTENVIEEEQQLLEEMMLRENAKMHFKDFLTYMMRNDPEYILPLSKFQLRLCQILEDLYYRKFPQTRFAVNLPFAHAKSRIATVYFVAWCLGKNKDWEVIVTSHKKEQALDFSNRTRKIFKSLEFKRLFNNVTLDPDADAAGKWNVRWHKGSYYAAGILEGIQGKRANLVVGDDLLGSQEDVNSEVIRNKVWNNWTGDVMSRLAPTGLSLIIASRQHLDDPTGRILELNKRATINERLEPWKIFSYPAIAEEPDDIGRQPGESLWPEFWPVHKLMDKKFAEYSGRDQEWSAHYQQKPMPQGGSIIARADWRIWSNKSSPKFEAAIIAYDTAYKDGQENDYSACTLWGIFREPKVYLTWAEKVALIRESDNSDLDLGYEFRCGPAIIKRIKAGENVSEPKFDGFDRMMDDMPPDWMEQNPYCLMLLKAWNEKIQVPELRQKISMEHEFWTKRLSCPLISVIEDKASGQGLIQDFARMGINMIQWPPKGSGRMQKLRFRANMISPLFRQGFVYALGKLDKKTKERSHTEFSDEAEMVIRQCEIFPGGVHDDIVSSLCCGLEYFRSMGGTRYEDDLDDDLEPQRTKVVVSVG